MNFLKQAYQWGWTTTTQLQGAVKISKLTAAEYKQITGEDYAG